MDRATIVLVAELSTNPVDAIRRSLSPPEPVPLQVAAALAALVPLPARCAEIERDELAAIDAVLATGGTWVRRAEVLGLGPRQAARQHGQRLCDRIAQRLADQQTAAEAPAPSAAADGAPGSVRHQPRRSNRRRRRR